jgi:hypothetical protein
MSQFVYLDARVFGFGVQTIRTLLSSYLSALIGTETAMSLPRRRLATSIINVMIKEYSVAVSQLYQYNTGRCVSLLGTETKQSWSSTMGRQDRCSVLVCKNAFSVRRYDSSSIHVLLARQLCGFHQHRMIHTVLGHQSQSQPQSQSKSQQEAKVDEPSEPPPPPPGMFATVTAMAAGAGGAVFVAAIGVWAVFQMAFWVAGRAATAIPRPTGHNGGLAAAQTGSDHEEDRC